MGQAVWEKMPDETPKAFAAFMLYLRLLPNERSYPRVTEALGQESTNTVERWASKYNWQERIGAYDQYRAQTTLVLVETSLDGAITDHIHKMTGMYAKAEQLCAEMLNDIDVRFHTVDDDGRPKASMIELQRAMRVAEQIDTAKRRLLGLPTAYLHETSDKEPGEAEVYFIGQGKQKTDDED